MALLNRVRAVWSGLPGGGTGVNTYYVTSGASGFVADLTAFYADVLLYCPTSVGVTVENAGDVITDTSGALSGTWSDGTVVPQGGSAGTLHAAGVGVRAVWSTGGITNGRRVKGSTFLCPLASGSYDADGTIKTADVAAMAAAASTLVTDLAGAMVILTRATAGSGGASHVVLSGTVADKVSWLRSRRT